jgi:hypothetical protein
VHGSSGLAVDWTLGDGAMLHFRANFSGAPIEGLPPAPGETIHAQGGQAQGHHWPAWSGRWSLVPASGSP